MPIEEKPEHIEENFLILMGLQETAATRIAALYYKDLKDPENDQILMVEALRYSLSNNNIDIRWDPNWETSFSNMVIKIWWKIYHKNAH